MTPHRHNTICVTIAVPMLIELHKIEYSYWFCYNKILCDCNNPLCRYLRTETSQRQSSGMLISFKRAWLRSKADPRQWEKFIFCSSEMGLCSLFGYLEGSNAKNDLRNRIFSEFWVDPCRANFFWDQKIKKSTRFWYFFTEVDDILWNRYTFGCTRL